MTNPDVILAFVSNAANIKAELACLNNELALCDTRNADLKRGRANLVDLVESEDINSHTFRERIGRLDKEEHGVLQLEVKLLAAIGNLEASVITPEQAQRTADEFVQSNRVVAGDGAARDGNSLDDFNFAWCREMVEKLNVKVNVGGERTILRGAISNLLLNLDPEWRGELGPASRRTAAIEARATCTGAATIGTTAQHSAHLRSTYRRRQPQRCPLRQAAALRLERPRPPAGRAHRDCAVRGGS